MKYKRIKMIVCNNGVFKWYFSKELNNRILLIMSPTTAMMKIIKKINLNVILYSLDMIGLSKSPYTSIKNTIFTIAFNLLVFPNSMLTPIFFITKGYVLSGEIALRNNHYYYITIISEHSNFHQQSISSCSCVSSLALYAHCRLGKNTQESQFDRVAYHKAITTSSSCYSY